MEYIAIFLPSFVTCFCSKEWFRYCLFARCGAHVQCNGSIVVYKFSVLCCHSLKAGSFLIFVCLALRSLGNLHKSQKAFIELGWIEVAASACFCIIPTTRITQNRHPRKFIQGKETKCLSLLFTSCASFFPFSVLWNFYVSVIVVFFFSFSTHTLIEIRNRCTLLLTVFISASQCVVSVSLLMQGVVRSLEQLITPNEGVRWPLNGC